MWDLNYNFINLSKPHLAKSFNLKIIGIYPQLFVKKVFHTIKVGYMVFFLITM